MNCCALHITLVGILMVGGCCNGPHVVYKTVDGRYLPDHWSKKTADFDPEAAKKLLRFDVVYVHENESPLWPVTWYRFWPGGQLHAWERPSKEPNKGPPSIAEADDFSFMGAGRYVVKGDRLLVEHITPTGELFCHVHYWYDEGTIAKDGSITFTWPDAWPGKGVRYSIYRPLYIGEMKRAPDWK